MRGKCILCVIAVCMLALSFGCKSTKHAQQTPAPTQHKVTAVKPIVDTLDAFNEYFVHDTAAEAKAAAAGKSVVSSSHDTTVKLAPDGRFVLQIACVPKRKQADSIVAKLGSHGLSAYVVNVDNPDRSMTGTFYRVRLAGFASRADAQAFGNSHLKEYGFAYWVDRKKKDAAGVGPGGLGGKNHRAYFE